MMKKRAAIKLLAASEDQDKLQGVLKQLRTQGVRISAANGALRKNDIVIAVLSDHFYADEDLRAQLFQQLAVGADTILPLKLGDSPVPEDIMNLLFARNIIMASERYDAQVAERILSAIPEKKNTMPMILSAAAVVLLLLGGLFLWYSTQKPEAEPVIMDDEPIPYPWGITEEDLAKIQNVIIVGDQFAYHTYEDIRETAIWPELYDFAYETWEDDGRHWYSTEDGHEYTLTRYDDLRFLELMPNLRNLRMVLVDVEPDMLPDLSGSKNLTNVSIHDCGISNLEWVAASSVISAEITGTNIADYSPLTRCDSLCYATIDGMGKYMSDVSGFAPPALQELYLSNFQPGEIDLAGLSGCTKLSRLTLDSLQINDLAFLEGMKSLNALILDNMPRLQDISAISSLTSLRELWIRQCDMVTDYTPISSCSILETINIERGYWIAVDSAFLNGLSHLNDIGLYGLNLNNMDFLATVNKGYGIRLGFAGDIQDYSGLAEMNRYQFLHVNPRNNGTSFGDFSLVAPYLQDKAIDEMELFNCTNVDLANLPKISSKLTITGGDLEDLSGLNSEHLYRLELRDMQYLRSLDGIEGLSKLYGNIMHLSILGCPRLTDFDALNGADLYNLNLVGIYSLPDFSELKIRTLCLESIADMEDLSCLETLDKNGRYQFKFLGLDDLKDLSVLRDFYGNVLYVPPQVADQAQELVERGNFTSYEVHYPESGWDPLTSEITLLSLEELETLPKTVLRRVSRVWIAGDEIIDPNRYEVWDEWVQDHPVAVLYDRQTNETRKISTGSITDFSMLSDLTNLWELRLFNQPITNLEGIQNLSNLSQFEAKFCPDLQDVSALYTLQGLEEISLQYTGINTIQGVQNLPKLRHLNVFDTEVTDLSPLQDCDFSYADETGGFVLITGNTTIEDLSPLSAIPSFGHLNICGYPPESWMQYVTQTPIRGFVAQMGSDETLRQFVEQHPELEEVNIEDGYHLTDLTPLLDLQNLNYVHVWDNAAKAGRSLNGFDRRFQLDID